jgi:hypothetical protein
MVQKHIGRAAHGNALKEWRGNKQQHDLEKLQRREETLRTCCAAEGRGGTCAA